jgi:hypothetical protein
MRPIDNSATLENQKVHTIIFAPHSPKTNYKFCSGPLAQYRIYADFEPGFEHIADEEKLEMFKLERLTLMNYFGFLGLKNHWLVGFLNELN